MIIIAFLLFFAGVFFAFIQNFLWASFLGLFSLGFWVAHFLQKASFISLREQNASRYLSDIVASQLQRNEEIEKHLELLQDNKEFAKEKIAEFQNLIQKLGENKIKVATILANSSQSQNTQIKSQESVNYSSSDYKNKIQDLKESDKLYEKFVEITKNYTTDQMYTKIQERIEKLSEKITNRIETYNSAVAIYNSDLFGWDRVFVARNKNLAEFYRN